MMEQPFGIAQAYWFLLLLQLTSLSNNTLLILFPSVLKSILFWGVQNSHFLFKKLHENITLKICFLSGTLKKKKLGPFNALKNSVATQGQNQFFFFKECCYQQCHSKTCVKLTVLTVLLKLLLEPV